MPGKSRTTSQAIYISENAQNNLDWNVKPQVKEVNNQKHDSSVVSALACDTRGRRFDP